MKVDVIYTDDCLEGMPKRLPDGCIDLMPTDPPYGIAFMGKEWDKFNEVVRPQGAYENVKGFKRLPRQSTASMEEFFVPRWRECLRVLKAGGFAFVMCSPRADVMATQILCLQEAGFMVGFTPIFWCFASGFPKAQNIGKAVDKRLGIKRKIIGKEKVDVGIQSGSMHAGRSSKVIEVNKTVATSPQAQALDGSYAGFQPKPAVEVVIVAMKPLSEKTYVDQALSNGKGITWLDDCRVPYKSEKDKEQTAWGRGKDNYFAMGTSGFKRLPDRHISSQIGRFPANLLVSDDALNDGRNHKSGNMNSIAKEAQYNVYGKMYQRRVVNKSSSGSFSRYFSLDAWFNKKLKELPKGVQKTFPFLIVPKASKAEKNRGCEKLYWEKDGSSFGYRQVGRARWEWLGKEEERIHKETGKRASLRARGNVHPTVKPIKLMSYLIALGSREGDVILDPYIGTGRTAVAATMMRRRYIGFDSSPESVKIAKAALSEVQLRLI